MKLKLLLLLFIVNTIIVNASKVDTVMVISHSMNKIIPTVVITPDSYTSQNERFPVVYVLHGAGGTYANWITRVPKLKAYADTYNMIIVCPDGGLTSWYFDSPIDESMTYETYISNELIKAVDSKYNTIANRSGRAITGLSMGGHGAFYLAIKHQDVWGAAGSMSGGLDIRPFPNSWELNKRLGDYADHKENWEDNTVINMLYKLKKDSLKLIFDIGINDFFYDSNKRLHEKLLERNIPHDYIVRPGSHNWDYWSNAIQYQLLYFNTYFKTKVAP